MRRVLIALVVLLAAGELIARYAVGIGTPALTVVDPKIEYMFKPNQDVWRFHRHILYNEYGMRSASLAASDHQRLVLAFGDSVLNGGAYVDHDGLATTIASRRLSEHGTATLVGNVSAGSWGPGNMLGWMQTYGLLGADTLILVLSSHDMYDVLDFGPLDPIEQPTEAPVSALWEGIVRYLPKLLPGTAARWDGTVLDKPSISGPPASQARVTADLETIFDCAAEAHTRVCVVQHLTQSELAGGPEPGYAALKAVFDARGVPHMDDTEWLRPNLKAEPAHYRDDIHISAAGHALLAEALLACDHKAVVPMSRTPAPSSRSCVLPTPRDISRQARASRG